MTELEDVYESADKNYRESLRLLGDSIALTQDFVDLYQRISDIAAGSPLALKDEHVMGVKFLMAARCYLVTGMADCLRCHLTDTAGKTRMAIEQAAFAARVKRHPHLAKFWLDAGEDETAYDEYRDRFRKLFPDDHALLKVLGERYDLCAKQTHPSIYSFAGRSKANSVEGKYFAHLRAWVDRIPALRPFLPL